MNKIYKLSKTKIISLINSHLEKFSILVKNVNNFLAEKTKAVMADKESATVREFLLLEIFLNSHNETIYNLIILSVIK